MAICLKKSFVLNRCGIYFSLKSLKLHLFNSGVCDVFMYSHVHAMVPICLFIVCVCVSVYLYVGDVEKGHMLTAVIFFFHHVDLRD